MDREFEEYLKKLQEKIRKLRTDSGLTYRQLAIDSKIPFNTLVSLETRKITDIQLSTLYKLVRYYKEDLNRILV